ncbi:GNAT family N-acetyltransferase [Mesorhizobium sp. M8A.F.Ca.ET.057.01.1.1]|uniref:GNAT family N-acetyltransferase n=1 Tax=Mesorhizobium sp. M8A.F.Ca.ET.057.01.1.1 TaxID=2493679 RepID=UPI003A8A9CE7
MGRSGDGDRRDQRSYREYFRRAADRRARRQADRLFAELRPAYGGRSPYADQPFGTLGIDLSIGRPELVGIGHGSAIVRQFVEDLFEEGVPRVIIDPDPANIRAIRAYEKAGFRAIDRRQSIYGDVVLMAIDAEDGQEG